MSVQHQNIVQLVGYCYETRRKLVLHNDKFVLAHVEERAICFEYLERGSLDKYLSGMIVSGFWTIFYYSKLRLCSKQENGSPNWYLNKIFVIYAADESSGFDWCTRYKIIKGICEGVNYSVPS